MSFQMRFCSFPNFWQVNVLLVIKVARLIYLFYERTGKQLIIHPLLKFRILKKKLNYPPLINCSELLEAVDHAEIIAKRPLSVANLLFYRFHAVEKVFFELTFTIPFIIIVIS